jgi:hypothetical protein
MTKQEKKLYNKVYKHYRYKMGIFWFGVLKKLKPINEYGFWLDSIGSEGRMFVPHQVPYNYVIDIFCDLVARSKLHEGKDWKTSFPSEYYTNIFKRKLTLHQQSIITLEKLLEVLSQSKNEKEFFKWYKKTSRLMKAIY